VTQRFARARAGPGSAEARAPGLESLEDLEIRLLLEGVWSCYGYDFRDYALSSLRRRIRLFMEEEALSTISSVQDRVLHDTFAMRRFLRALSVNVTAMFRDPSFYRALREVVVPVLRTYPAVRIWHAGCATGEEVYSVAILLQEEGLYDRCRLYATDINEAVVRRPSAASSRSPPCATTRGTTWRRAAATGSRAGTRRATVTACWTRSCRRNISFAHHNLATDGSFNEFHLIVCRNVLIYFNRHLQERVHRCSTRASSASASWAWA
jgi:chemotaxis protein methyltransferase CheR